MTKQAFVLLIALVVGVGFAEELAGCGDKFLSAARGTRFQQAPRGQQEKILVYADPSSDVATAVVRLSAESVLQRAGYLPTIITTAADLERELSQGSWDLVVAGMADAEAISRRLLNDGGVLPVVLKSAKSELKESQLRFPVVLTKATNAQGFLRAVSQALASRSSLKAD